MEEVEALPNLEEEEEAVEGDLEVEEAVVHLGGRVEDRARIEGTLEGDDTTTTLRTTSTAIFNLSIREEMMQL
jgi:hypothetical protein